MARRTRVFKLIPWIGGINSSVDPGVLNNQELVQADNVQFSSTGARIKREALEYLDPAVPTPTFRSSSGTTRTLKFAADDLVTTSPANEKLVVGERITVSGVSDYNATDVAVLSVNDLGSGIYSITYTAGSSITEAETAAGSITIERASSVISITDYWRWDGTQNVQRLVYATDDFQMFYLDDGGRRVQVDGQEQVSTITCGAASTLTTGDYWTLNSANDVTSYYVWYDIASGGGDPGLAGMTGVPVVLTGAETAAQVATATQLAVDALTDFVAAVNTTVVTVTNASAGITTATSDGNTGFTFTTTTYGATVPLTAVNTIRTLVFNESLIMVFSGVGNKPIIYNPDTNAKYQLLDLTAPDASIIFEHQGRIWLNDKTDRDRLHYSETFDETKWLGLGDSGAFPIGQGDGDPEGIVNGYKYKGFAVIGKKARRYRILGDSPENYELQLISEGLGNEGSLAVPVDESDVVFMSRRGLHSQQATDVYGDTDSRYLSAKIKPTFNTFNASRLKFTQGAYIPELNSIAFSIASSGAQAQDEVWLYNTEVNLGEEGSGAWYRWPDISCQALSRRFIAGKYKLVFGTAAGRIIQAQKANNYSDFGDTGIEFRIKSGSIYVDGDPQTLKTFRKISMFYRPTGNFEFTVKAYIDNFTSQSFSFNQVAGLDLLGETFVLGNSLLGSSAKLAPFTFTFDGRGRGITLEVLQTSEDEQVELWGIAIEYEPDDIEQETE